MLLDTQVHSLLEMPPRSFAHLHATRVSLTTPNDEYDARSHDLVFLNARALSSLLLRNPWHTRGSQCGILHRYFSCHSTPHLWITASVQSIVPALCTDQCLGGCSDRSMRFYARMTLSSLHTKSFQCVTSWQCERFTVLAKRGHRKQTQ